MIYMRFTGISDYKLAVEKYRDSIFTTITTIWKTGFSIPKCELRALKSRRICLPNSKYYIEQWQI
jgi:hypothetical protein